MKKICLTLLIPLFNLCGCNQKDIVNPLFGVEEIENRIIVKINSDKLASMIENKKTFILIQTTNTCKCSKNFKNLVNQYVIDYGTIIYEIDYKEITKKDFNISIRDNAPTFHAFKLGKHINSLEKIMTITSDPFFTNKDDFYNFMDTYFIKPSIFYIEEENLEKLYQQDKIFSVYFAKDGCLECEYLKNVIFNEYAQEKNDLKKIYIIDLNKFEGEEFDFIRNKYGLSEESNSTWGYKKGALPVIHLVDPSKNHSIYDSTTQAYMFGNDILNESYEVTSSYYTQDRLNNILYTSNFSSTIGKKFNKENAYSNDGYITLNNKTNDGLYRQLFKDFIEYYNKL